MIDYRKGTLRIHGQTVILDDLRKWISDSHPEVMLSHRIKSIYTSTGSWVMTYDWDAIFQKVIKNNLIYEYYSK